MIHTVVTWNTVDFDITVLNTLRFKLHDLLDRDIDPMERYLDPTIPDELIPGVSPTDWPVSYEKTENTLTVTRGWPSREIAEEWKSFILTEFSALVTSIEIIEI